MPAAIKRSRVVADEKAPRFARTVRAAAFMRARIQAFAAGMG